MTFARRFEIARIVEDVVFRQQRLVGKAEQLPIANNGGGVVEAAAGCRFVGPHSADDRGDTFSCLR